MAKGSFNGVITGKKGNTVFYRLKNSNNAEKQGWREYNAKVGNPQTDGQIDQRVKMLAVNNLYRALKPIIQRGWENHKYGDDSRRAFLKRALGASFRGPYIEKGSTLAVPIEGVPITYGSLTPVTMECGNQIALFSNVLCASSPATIGDVSQALIDSDVAIVGDQFTLILGTMNLAGGVTYYTRSFYVDPSSAVPVVDVFGFIMTSVAYDDVDVLAINISDLAPEISSFSLTHFCALCSISRDGETSNLRSYAEFDMTSEFRSYFYGNAAQQAAAKRSYRRQQSADTNWPLVPGGGGYTPVVQSAYTRAGSEFTPIGIRVVDPGQNQYLCIYDGEGNNYYIESFESTSGSLRTYLTGPGAYTTAAPTGMTTANSVDVYDANNVAAGLRAWLISKGVSQTLLPVRS